VKLEVQSLEVSFQVYSHDQQDEVELDGYAVVQVMCNRLVMVVDLVDTSGFSRYSRWRIHNMNEWLLY